MTSGPLATPPDRNREEQSPALARDFPRRPQTRRQRVLKIALPLAAIAVAIAVRALLFATEPTAATADPNPVLPTVLLQSAVPETVRLEVIAHGTVTPHTESDLVAEVRGRVVEASPHLEAGVFFSKGDELLRLDGREPAIAVQRARANVKLRQSEARLAEREAERRRALAKRDAASASDLHQFESRSDVANAALEEARAQLAQAELDLERTVLRAPFDGRVRQRLVDVGQFVNPGTALARIYAVDYAEIRLPIRTSELAQLELPDEFDEAATPSPVTLSADLGGKTSEWPALLTRSEGSIDPQTRMMYVVARVDDPYARRDRSREPLPAGLFVRGAISGREVRNAFRFPAIALREGAFVFVVDDENRLYRREVDVVQRGRDEVLIGGGLQAGERVVVSPLRLATDGMRVRTAVDATEPRS